MRGTAVEVPFCRAHWIEYRPRIGCLATSARPLFLPRCAGQKAQTMFFDSVEALVDN